jgi:hypothetical protein
MSAILAHGWTIMNPQLVAELWAISADPVHAKCRSYIQQNIHAQGLSVYAAGNQLKPTSAMKELLDTYYLKCSQDALDWIDVVGVVPVQYLRTASGEIVPQCVNHTTIDLYTKYDINSEQLIVRAKRNATSGLGAIGHANTAIQESYDAAEQRGVQRIDMSLDLPENDEFDNTITVLTGFGFDPTPNGIPSSLIFSSYELVMRHMQMQSMFVTYHTRMLEFRPFCSMEGLTAMELESISKGTTVPSEASDDGDQMHYRRTAAEIGIYLRRTQEFNDFQRTRYGATSDQYSTPLQKLIAANSINEASASSGSSNQYIALPPGLNTSNYQPPGLTWAQYIEWIKDYEQQIVNLYGLPVAIFRNMASTQGNVELQNRFLHGTLHSRRKILERLMSDIYNTITQGANMRWALSELRERWLRPQMEKRLLDAIVAMSISWLAQATGDNYENHEGDIRPIIDELLTSRPSLRELKGINDRREVGSAYFISQVKRYRAKSNGAVRIGKRSRRHYSPFQREAEQMLATGEFDAYSEDRRERAIAANAVFYKAIKDTSTGKLFDIIDQTDDEDERKWLDNVGRETIKHAASYRFEITYSTPTHIPFNDLLQRAAIGLITPDELNHLVRTECNLPVTNDHDLSTSTKDYVAIIENVRGLLQSQTMKDCMATSIMGPILGAAESSIRDQIKQSVDTQLMMMKQSHAHEIALLTEKMSAKDKANGSKSTDSDVPLLKNSDLPKASSEKKSKQKKK